MFCPVHGHKTRNRLPWISMPNFKMKFQKWLAINIKQQVLWLSYSKRWHDNVFANLQWDGRREPYCLPVLNHTTGFIRWVYCANVGFAVSDVTGLFYRRKLGSCLVETVKRRDAIKYKYWLEQTSLGNSKSWKIWLLMLQYNRIFCFLFKQISIYDLISNTQ